MNWQVSRRKSVVTTQTRTNFTLAGSDRERTAPSPPPTAPHYNTTAYEVFMELPYVDGLFLMRNWEGQVVCYDLRQK